MDKIENESIDLENVKLEDCVELYEKKGVETLLEDGKITRFQEVEEKYEV